MSITVRVNPTLIKMVCAVPQMLSLAILTTLTITVEQTKTKVSSFYLNHENAFETCILHLVQLCPTSHPISCASGSKCTNLQQVLASPCKRLDITDGNCCPSDSILCNDNDASKICMSNPEYGKTNFQSKNHFKQPTQFSFINL